MSGIFGIINLNHALIESADLSLMADALQRRGPDSQSFWLEGEVGLGHTLLATTESALFEHLPFRDVTSGCVITADARIDNREELITNLGIDIEAKCVGDGELILRAYLKWGHSCSEHLMGDFAFAVWDPRSRELFCARDHFGMRPFNFYHISDKIFVFASSVSAVLALKQVIKKINEVRIADFLYDFEAVDTVSTFYENIYRLSPAHFLCVSDRDLEVSRYWRLQAGPMLNLSSDADYVEAFLEVFTASVKSRLVSADIVGSTLGSMLSGGMDSGSVVAIASRILANQNLPPLKTFSAVGPDAKTCVETRSIHAAMGLGSIEPQMLNYAELSPYINEIRATTLQVEEPFDCQMSLIRSVYHAAHLMGVRVMLDGGAGDTVLSEGRQMARLIRSGHWLQALNNGLGLRRFYGSNLYPLSDLARDLFYDARSAFTPEWIRSLKRSLFFAHEVVPLNTIINPAFARRVDLSGRLAQLKSHSPKPWLSYAEERVEWICHPNLIVGRERYGRIASAYGIEPRDPFLDTRLVDFCLRLPGRQLQSGGWPKLILRLAMAGRLPDDVRWRLGQQHLGPKFTSAVFSNAADGLALNADDLERLSPYLAPALLSSISNGVLQGYAVNEIISLAIWLRKSV